LLSNTANVSSWFEISIQANPKDVPVICDFLSNISTNGMTIEPAIELLTDIDFGYTYLDKPSTIRTYTEKPFTSKERINFRKKLNQLTLSAKIPRIQYRIIENHDWSNEWKKYYNIQHVGKNIVICPSWLKYQPRKNEKKITLDPGAAFGTGQHPTSQLCLIALEKHLQKQNTVIDLGCGSGILSIGAIFFGAKSIYALDIDAKVIQVTIENAKKNHTLSKIQVAKGTLGNHWPDQFPSQASLADILIANISTNTILDLTVLIKNALKNEGLAILSGFINEHTHEIQTKLKQLNFKIVDTLSDSGWTCIVAMKI
tara:strand:- start:12097 stop:13038 length:942 start_codon:yes stop_codon:yes gene_type:complete